MENLFAMNKKTSAGNNQSWLRRLFCHDLLVARFSTIRPFQKRVTNTRKSVLR